MSARKRASEPGVSSPAERPPGMPREAADTSLARKYQRLENKIRLKERQLSDKVKRLSILYEVGQALSGTHDLQCLMKLIVKLAARHLKARKASIMLIDESTGLMRINASVGIRKWVVERSRMRVGEGIAGRVAASGEPVHIKDIATDSRYGRPSRGTYFTGSFIIVPLRLRGRVLGVLNVSDKRSREPFDADDSHLVNTLASEAAVAVENATLYSNLKEKINSLEELYLLREQERRQLDTLVNSITDGILAVDKEGRGLYANRRARDCLELSGLCGPLPLRDLLPEGELGKAIGEDIDSALHNMVKQRGVLARCGPAAGRHFDLLSLPVQEESGGSLGALTIIRDVTEAKRLDQMRSDFLSRASHQLKTPVGLISGFADTLVKNPDLDPERRTHFLDLVHSEAKRLADLIENLLDLARIESDILHMEMEMVDPVLLLDGVLPAIRAKGVEKGIDVMEHLEGDLPPLETDPRCLAEVLRNILDNSLKFTPRGGRVSLGAQCRGTSLCLWVSDTGSGIDEADLPYIFDKFFVGRTGRGRGTGLGLFIAKEMTNMLGGDLSVVSRPGEGTVVTVSIPLAEGPPKE